MLLAKALVRRNHTVTILIPPWDDPKRSGQTWEEDGVRVVNVSLPPNIPFFFHVFLTRALVAQALTLQPDVIHFFKPKAYAGLAHLILWWLRRVGGVSARLVVDSDDWEQAWNDLLPYSSIQKKLFTWQEQWGLQHADAVTAASRTVEKLVAGYRTFHPSGIFYVPNGYVAKAKITDVWHGAEQVPDDKITPQAIRSQWQLGQSPVILLYTRFDVFRLERIVTLVQRISERLPKARWLIVGRGLRGEDQTLADKLTRTGLADFVRFTGWVPFNQLTAHFNTVDVAAFPYDNTLINRTKCSVKLIDLLAAGVAVVADDVGQNREYIEHNVSGILVQAEDDDAFAAAITDLLQHPKKSNHLGQAAIHRIHEVFNWTNLSQIAERAYH